MKQPIAIQSWCFRHFKTLPEYLAKLKECGVTATEMCGVHARYTERSEHAGILAEFKKAGVTLVAIGVENLKGDIEAERSRFEFCKAAGIKSMSITFGPKAMFDALHRLEKLADEYDINLGIHNHGGYDWLGNSVILKHVFENTSKRIGLYLDTAWAIDAKQNPIQMVETFGDRLHGVHVKDFIYDRARHPQDVIIGTGNLDLPKFMKALEQVKFTGPLVIEYEGDEQNPVPALSECVKVLKKLV